MRKTEILTDADIRNAKPKKGKTIRRLLDGDRLYLQASVAQSALDINRNWVFRYELDGDRHDYGIGPYPAVSLGEARRRAGELRLLILDGIDPLQERIEARKERLAAKAKRVKAKTFKECAERYYEIHRKGWKNDVYRKQWHSNMVRYVYPLIGDLNVGDVDHAHIEQVLTPIWDRIPDSANKIQGQISRVLDWAKAGKLRDGENPAARNFVTARLGKLKRGRNHHAAMAIDDAPTLVAELRADKSLSALALEFTILCCARTAETIEATWDEIHLKKRVWVVPAARMKSGKEHRVALCDRALEIVGELQRHGPYVFASPNGKPLSNMAMLAYLQRRHPDLTVHGFRSTFRDWAADRTNYPEFIYEMALAHAVGDETVKAYKRTDLLERRVRLMDQWAKFLAKPQPKTGEVHDLKAERERRAS